jgi:hypothetical protein
MCVLSIGERGLGLWTDAPPSPDVRVAMPFDGIAAIERLGDGRWRRLTVTGNDTGFSVTYAADGDASADIWTRRLRLRCAGHVDSLPGEHRTSARLRNLWPWSRSLRPFLIEPGDEAVVAGWRSASGYGSCLLAVTAREINVVNSARSLIRPWRRRARVLYVPRSVVTGAIVTSRTLRLRSAGTDVCVRLPSRGLAAAASRWLTSPPAEALTNL